MAYAIELRDINQWLDFASPVVIGDTGEWEVKFKVKFHATPNRDILGVYFTANEDYLYYRVSTQQFKWQFDSGSQTLNAPSAQVLGEWLEVSIKQTVAGGKYIEIPSLGLISGVYALTKVTTINKIGSDNDAWAADMQLDSAIHYSDLTQTTVVNNWDATASSHVAGTPVLLDTVGGNNATATASVPTNGDAWIDLDLVLPVAITLQPLPVTELENTAWTLTSSASEATSSEWYKDGSPTGNTTDTIGGTGLLSESGNYYNLYTNGVTPLATDTVAVLIQEPFTEIISTTDVKLGEAFTITTNGIDDLTASTTITATYGDISLLGESNVTANTVDFLAPVSGLELDDNHNLVITVDGTPSSNFAQIFLAPTGYTAVTLTGISEFSWLAMPPYSGNGGSDADNMGVGDQVVYQNLTNEVGTEVVIDDTGIVSMPNGVADGVVTDQTISWFYLEAQDGYDASGTQLLTLLAPALANPTLNITDSDSNLLVGEVSTITFTFSEAVTGFDASNIVVTNGSMGALSGSGASYSAVFTPSLEFNGVGVISVADGSFESVGGDLGIGDDISINIDTVTAPPSSSVLNMVGTGTPDGVYVAKFYNDALDVFIVSKNVTFLGGNASSSLDVAAGTAVHSLILGNNPPVTGMAYVGATE